MPPKSLRTFTPNLSKMSITKTAMVYLVNHVFLPPRFPNGDDWESIHDSTMQSTLLASIKRFEAHIAPGRLTLVRSAAAMIRRMIESQDENGRVHLNKLEHTLHE